MNEQCWDFEIPYSCSNCIHRFSGICLIGDKPGDLGCMHFKEEIARLSKNFEVENETGDNKYGARKIYRK